MNKRILKFIIIKMPIHYYFHFEFIYTQNFQTTKKKEIKAKRKPENSEQDCTGSKLSLYPKQKSAFAISEFITHYRRTNLRFKFFYKNDSPKIQIRKYPQNYREQLNNSTSIWHVAHTMIIKLGNKCAQRTETFLLSIYHEVSLLPPMKHTHLVSCDQQTIFQKKALPILIFFFLYKNQTVYRCSKF